MSEVWHNIQEGLKMDSNNGVKCKYSPSHIEKTAERLAFRRLHKIHNLPNIQGHYKIMRKMQNKFQGQ